MDGSAALMWSVAFGAFGMGYFVYGKKQQRYVALLSGIALCIYPYFVANLYLLIAIGVALMALPFLIRE